MTEEEFHRLIEGETEPTIGTNVGEEALSPPVVDFVNRILHEAVKDGADRIYFAHSPGDFAISFIVNDKRHEMAHRPALLGLLVLTCLKSIAPDSRIRIHQTEFELFIFPRGDDRHNSGSKNN